MGQIVPVILRDLEGLVSNAVVEVLRGESPVSNARPLGPSRGYLARVGGGGNETTGGTAMEGEREGGGGAREERKAEGRVEGALGRRKGGKTEKMESRQTALLNPLSS